MDDVLVVGSSFDPSGLTRGLAAGEAALKHFEQAVRQLDIQTGKALDFGTLGALSAKAFRDSAAAVAAYETRVRDAVQSVVGLNQANVDAFAGSIQAATGAPSTPRV